VDIKDLESQLWAKAMASGHIDSLSPAPQMPDPADDDAPTAIWGARIQGLIRQGRIPRALVEQWLRELVAEGEVTEASLFPFGAQDDGFSHPLPDPDRPRFEQLQLVGIGGAGRVYKAFDPMLQRWVALKYLRWESDQVKEHLLTEARAQAKVKHPHVREVFEVGEWDGEAFIAMRWIEGEPLHRVSPKLGWREVTALMIDVCEGVQAAHEQGLLHLDLKPGNILVEFPAQGPPKAFVTDFGLVVEVGGSSDSTPRRGGTLPYASPEQLGGGGVLDARSDVYGLGITLHVALSGRFPHQETSNKPGVMDRVPEDLMRVARRACAVVPSQRHATVKALAEDLRHVLDGRPIEARRGEWAYRSRLWIRRHPGAAVGLLAGVLMGGALLGWLGINRRQYLKQRELAQRFGEDTREALSQVRLAHLSPPHDRRAQMADVYAAMKRIETSMASLDESAQGPGHAALGRIHLVLEQWELAQSDYEKAWAKGYRMPEVAAQLGMVQGLMYLLERTNEADLPTGDPERRARMNAWKASSIELMALAKAQLPPEALPPGLPVMQAEVEDRSEDAKRMGWKALEIGPRDPWHYEPLRLAMEVWDDRVQRLIGAHRFEEAESWLTLLDAAVSKALEVGRSDPNLYSLQGYAAFDRAHLTEIRGGQPTAYLERAIESFRKAREMDPSIMAPIRWGADGLRRLSEIRMAQGLPVLAQLDEASSLIGPYTDLSVTERPWRNRYVQVRILSVRAVEKLRLGMDARADIQQASEYMSSIQKGKVTREVIPARVLPLELAKAWQAEKEKALTPEIVVDLGRLLSENAPSPLESGAMDLGSQATLRMATQFMNERTSPPSAEWRRAWQSFEAALMRYRPVARHGASHKGF
jgi:serine/threonine protein kinase